MPPPHFRSGLLLACLLASVGTGAPTTRPAVRLEVELPAGRRRALERELAQWDDALRRDPASAAAHQRRGLAAFRLGRITECLADFDRYLERRPEDAPHHWQRGIALYYAGRYADGARQFEIHRTVNPNDVENAAWHYLCVARAAIARGEDRKQAVEKARGLLIPIEGDRRVPMMNVHALYAGKGTPQDVLAAAKAGEAGEEERKERLFYAHLYLGLWHEAAGQAEEARKHIGLAAKEYAQDHYMADVARVHAATLAKVEAGKK